MYPADKEVCCESVSLPPDTQRILDDYVNLRARGDRAVMGAYMDWALNELSRPSWPVGHFCYPIGEIRGSLESP